MTLEMTSIQTQSAAHMVSNGLQALPNVLQIDKHSQERRNTRSNNLRPLQTATSAANVQTARKPQSSSTIKKGSSVSSLPGMAPAKALPKSHSKALAPAGNTSSMTPRTEDQQATPSEDPRSPICRSPKWSDSEEQERKRDKRRVEREAKEKEKATRKETERQLASMKPAKRLTKKPPAAMETQRMPASLRSDTVTDVGTLPDTPRSSRERGRSSISSITSSIIRFSRSSSRSRDRSSVTEDQPPETRKRSSSRVSLSKILPWASSKEKDTLASPVVATQPEASPQRMRRSVQFLPDSVHLQPEVRHSIDGPPNVFFDAQESPYNSDSSQIDSDGQFYSSRKANKHGRSAASREALAEDLRARRKISSSMDTAKLSESDAPSQQTGMARHQVAVYQSPRLTDVQQKAQQNLAFTQAAGLSLPLEATSIMAREPVAKNKDSSPTGSYVHKQRMYQQQQSIAGFRDEIAIRQANDLPTPNPTYGPISPPTPDTSTESLHKQKAIVPEPVNVRRGRTRFKEQFSDSGDDQKPQAEGPSPIESDPRIMDRPRPKRKSNKDDSNARREEPDSTTSEHIPPLKLVKTTLPNFTEFHKRQNPQSPSPALSFTQDDDHPTKFMHDPARLKKERPDVSETRKQSHKSSITSKNDGPQTPRKSSKRQRSSPRESIQHKSPGGSQHDLSTASSSSTSIVTQFVIEDKPPVPGPKPSKAFRDSMQIAGQVPSRLQSTIPDIIVKGTRSNDVLREASMKKHRSDDDLKTTAAATSFQSALPSFDFLPPLKHQPLPKSKTTQAVAPAVKSSPLVNSSTSTTMPAVPSPLSTSSTIASHKATSKLPYTPPALPSSSAPQDRSYSPMHQPVHLPLLSPPQKTNNRRSARVQLMNPAHIVPNSKGQMVSSGAIDKPVAKMFVICCKCKFWHDLPSRMYEMMAIPKSLRKGEKDGDEESKLGNAQGTSKAATVAKGKEILDGKIWTTVKCPWCEHAMSTTCCAGWTAIVYLHERHH